MESIEKVEVTTPPMSKIKSIKHYIFFIRFMLYYFHGRKNTAET